MRSRTTFLGVGVACLVGGACWWILHQHAGDGLAEAGTVVSSGRLFADEAVPPGEVLAHAEPSAGVTIMQITSPAELREVLRFTRSATRQDRASLLDAALQAQDPLVAGSAVRALGRLGCFTSAPELLALTADPRSRVRQDAVIACGLDGGSAGISYLQDALSAGDASLRPLVIDALARIGGPLAHEVIQGVASDPHSTEIDRVFAGAALNRK